MRVGNFPDFQVQVKICPARSHPPLGGPFDIPALNQEGFIDILDGAFFLPHGGDGGPEPGIALGITATHAGGYGDFLDEFGKYFPSLGIRSRLKM